MQLAGIPIPDVGVLQLARFREVGVVDVAEKLENGYDRETKVVALTVVDRESILWALDERPGDRPAELRGVLLAEHAWRVREGLV